MSSVNPYHGQEPRRFWRRAVSDINFLEIQDTYRKKFPISPEMRIVTAGSCFAQHIARHMRSQGFNFCDYEPAPDMLPHELHARFGYGVFSARYANIYTTRQLLQLFQRAFGTHNPADEVWHCDNRYYDPYRPAIEPDGFASYDEFLCAQATHFTAIRRVFQESDVFVFTLGLTEGWINKSDGSVYPMCPGTVAGRFDPQQHVFRNFSYPEVISDMKLFLSLLRDVNPTVKVLLTVSPVPLTATAEDQHVLVATTYSKSLLRAAAGELARLYDYVDYFPSYELITSAPARAMFFRPNMREVAQEGVSFVMRHFFSQHQPDDVSREKTMEDKPPEENLKRHDDDIVCEEMLLEEVS